jgi:hypothetical protein
MNSTEPRAIELDLDLLGPSHAPNGYGDSLDDAKAAFRAAWDRAQLKLRNEIMNEQSQFPSYPPPLQQ